MQRNPIAAIVYSALMATAARAQTPIESETAPTGDPIIASLDLRISPLMDLMMLVRGLAEQEEAVIPDVAGLHDAVQTARDIQAALGGSSGWGVFLGPCSSAATAAEMKVISEQLPERFTSRAGTSFKLRELSGTFSDALAQAEPAFLAELWPQRKPTLERRRDALTAALKPKEVEIYRFIQDALAVSDPQPTIPVYLVNEAPWPGAMTYRSRAGGVCFVGSDGGEGSQLLETVIHESLHALDATSKSPDVFDQLAAALAEAGVKRSDPRMRDIPHMLMFVHGAEVVRRHLNPDHIDYGELEMFGRPGLYARDRSSVDAVRPAWRAYLDGKIDRDEAIRRMVEHSTAEDE